MSWLHHVLFLRALLAACATAAPPGGAGPSAAQVEHQQNHHRVAPPHTDGDPTTSSRRHRAAAAPESGQQLVPKAFTFIPLADTKPRGWLLEQSRIQADTLGGHLQYFFVNNSLWMKDYANLSAVPYPQKDLETVPCARAPLSWPLCLWQAPAS
jgi:hypothetical protein